MKQSLSVKEISDRLSVTRETVLVWINSGELPATNVGTRPGLKVPRWRVKLVDLEAFELSRQATPPAKKTRRRATKETANRRHF